MSAIDEVAAAARALAFHGLVTAFGHVSCRVDDTMAITPPRSLGTVSGDNVLRVPLDTTTLPPGIPPEAWAHLELYRTRPDVSAIARAMPPSAFSAAAVTSLIPVLHGQSAWLGDAIAVHPGSALMRSAELAAQVVDTLGEANAVVVRGNGALTTGDRPGSAVARMYLLEVACRVWLEATRAGTPHQLSLQEIRGWQTAAPQLLPRLWEFLDSAASR